LVVSGHEIELDRTILDDISEPLIHLLRNAVFYGIESPATRAQLGKPETGTITLSGRREADRVVLEVDDDGKGIDVDEVRSVAVGRGFVSADQAQALSPQEVIGLLFLPGLSTASAVTEVAGRGVGLNIVRTRVEALRGSIEVKTTPGRGARFLLRFPPTLAILEALLVRVGEELFAIPMVDIAEVIEIDRADLETTNILFRRDRAVPLVDLAQVLELGASAGRHRRAFVLISSLTPRGPGFVVDQVAGQQEIVIKPIDRVLNRIGGISGATILGDGRVVLILDLQALVREERIERVARTGDV
jgi:two-component system chemotaxis sensor kinase CheA